MFLKSENKINPNFSMSSMTDIVFLLLIFFMLTSTLVTTNALDIVLPSSSAQPLKKQTISISITEDLRYFINNESIERIFLESKIQTHMKGNDTTIILRAAQTIPLEYVVEVMDVAYRNNFKIVLATQPN
ncbi:MAG: biopolymer transporter ExbD [Flavobacteriales bacterium TMED191]|nr:MAG: biopolymer transporter ExbD [Flavobacteriales bacterium TMED191]|tara:strand:- start:75 stop:464 length:390 start_codon:yes stop_codon:yes gene_type:complete